MELDDLKTGWSVLNERLQQNEILNKRIVKEMIANRTRSAYDRLFRLDTFSVILVVIIAIVCLPLVFMNVPHIKLASFILLEGTMFVAIFMQLLIISKLLKFNIETKPTYELTKVVYDYKLWMRRNQLFGMIFAFAVIVAFLIIQGTIFSIRHTMLIAIFLVFGVGLAFVEYKFYLKNIATIEQGIKELKEFEE